jgi:hypothetical protein
MRENRQIASEKAKEIKEIVFLDRGINVCASFVA